MTFLRILLAVSTTAAVFAADAVVAGPVSGVVFDARSHSIRVVNGVPGSAMLGDTIAEQIDAAEIAPNGKAALVSKGGQVYAVADLRGATSKWVPLFAAAGVDKMAWNANSTAAAVYSSKLRNVALITNTSSQLNFSVDSLPGSVSALAVDQAATSVIAAAPGGVYRLHSDGPPVLLAGFDQPSALNLIHQDQDLLVADAATQRVFQIHGAGIIPFLDGVAAAGFAASADERFIFAADRICKCIGVYEFATRQLTAQLPVDLTPSFVKPIANGRQYLLNAPADNSTAFWILDTGDTPSAYFVSGGM